MYDNYIEILKARLDEKRFNHSINVANTARELAVRFGADEKKAYLAGLFHDICKNDSNENLLQIINEFGIMLDNIQKHEKKLWHAIAGAAYIQNVLNIDDFEIINAVKYHTTARENMTQLEKIIYIADFISLDREYDGVHKLRESAKNGLESAVFDALQFTIIDLSERGKPIHPDTMKAYNHEVLCK